MLNDCACVFLLDKMILIWYPLNRKEVIMVKTRYMLREVAHCKEGCMRRSRA